MDTLSEVQVFFPVEPFGKQRPRIGKWGGYTPKKTIDAEAALVEIYQTAIKTSPFECPVSVHMDFYFGIPKSYTKTQRLAIEASPVHTKKPDVDNLAKLVLDAMNGVAYKDDALVYSIGASKWYATGNQQVGIFLKISPINGR